MVVCFFFFLFPFFSIHFSPFPKGVLGSSKSGSTSRLDRLDLGQGQGRAAEPSRQLVAVEEATLRGRYWAEIRARVAANAAAADCDGLAKRSVLLGMVAVGAEGVVRGLLGGRGRERGGKRLRRRLRVRVRGVIDGSYSNDV